MPISQEKLGHFVVIRRYRWALVGAVAWSISILASISLIVLAVVTGKSLSFQEISGLSSVSASLFKAGVRWYGIGESAPHKAQNGAR